MLFRSAEAVLEISHCGIWDYRKKAEKNGVKLTFEDPCSQYCSKLNNKLIESKECKSTFNFTRLNDTHGCKWKIYK